MKVAVIGGAGYIGAHIVDLLCEQNYKVVVFDNLSSGFKENLNVKAGFFNGDILDKSSLDFFFSNYKFDGIIHMAAFKSAGESMINSKIFSRNNIIGSINLISMAVKYNINKFIFSSTAAVYGEPLYNPIDEKHSTNPINHYGFTKLFIEKYLYWTQERSGLKYVALRYFNAAGYTGNKDSVKFKERNPQNLLPLVMEVANGSREKLNVFGNDYDTHDGTCIRDYINVIDLADAHIKALAYLDYNKSCSINLSTGVGHSVLDVINISRIITGKKISYKFSERRVGDPEILISSNYMAKQKLKWSPKVSSLNEIVKSMWMHYK